MGYWRRDMKVAIHVISFKYFAYLIILCVHVCVCAPAFAFFKKNTYYVKKLGTDWEVVRRLCVSPGKTCSKCSARQASCSWSNVTARGPLALSSTPFVVAGQRETSRQLIDKFPALKGQGWGAAGSFNQDHMVTGGLCMLRHAGEDLHGAKNGVAG